VQDHYGSADVLRLEDGSYPSIGARFPLSDMLEVIRELGTAHGRGKVVVRV
jgi:hypothetical protein